MYLSHGMACYPEHEESPNMESEIYYTKMKLDNSRLSCYSDVLTESILSLLINVELQELMCQ